ncbi:MAG: hypothetical protein PVI86_09010 [Phycisphaerae bacterium]|jgi:hypothetical protein
MQGMYRCLCVAAPLLIVCAGCQKPRTADGLQLARMDEARRTNGAAFNQMVDNAVLRDMSVADLHFIPHTDELSGIGVARLDRLARLLQVYGGTVRYETLVRDDDLIEHRLDHVREYLALAGCDMDRVDLVSAMSGGQGLPGDEAVQKMIQGTAPPDDSSGTTTFLPGVMAQPQG